MFKSIGSEVRLVVSTFITLIQSEILISSHSKLNKIFCFIIDIGAASICMNNPCKCGGTCIEQGASDFLCVCPSQCTGKTCDTKLCKYKL